MVSASSTALSEQLDYISEALFFSTEILECFQLEEVNVKTDAFAVSGLSQSL